MSTEFIRVLLCSMSLDSIDSIGLGLYGFVWGGRGVVVRRGSWIYFDSGCGHAFYMRSNGFELLGFSV